MRIVAAMVLVVACGTAAPVSAPDAGQACVRSLDCGSYACVDGHCDHDIIIDYPCAARDERCFANDIMRCKDDRSGWTFVESCAFACQAGVGTASCIVCTCDPNSPDAKDRIVCQGDEVMVCRTDCSGFDPVQKCSNGCDPATAACR